MKKSIEGGTVHKLPADLKKAIASDKKVLALWQNITPLARNEWICWVTSGKLSETRDIRIKKGLSKMRGGMRRPCCWSGCIHRPDKALSRSQKFVMNRQSNKRY
ncbi:MAG TPA: YdeI/OmpD-associated family protein [Candidatus Paceibacterota bacterium]|nr:YdeI/OmpD-associated family protein [Candidatus Paceibacterota bacterium]